MPKVLIVEDHPVVVEGLQKLLKEKGIASDCIFAYTFKECLDTLKLISPDLILMDYHLPDGNGIDLCEKILSQKPDTKILAISSFKEQSLVKRMIESGAKGYVLKNASESEIIEAVTTILAGGNYISEDAQEILETKDEYIVTRREVEVLKLISDGLTNQEIADKLFISPFTVDSHRKNLIIKLNAKNTASLIKIAISKGLLDIS